MIEKNWPMMQTELRKYIVEKVYPEMKFLDPGDSLTLFRMFQSEDQEDYRKEVPTKAWEMF